MRLVMEVTEHRLWLCKVHGFKNYRYVLIHGYPDFQWPRDSVPPITKHEIPKKYWGLSLNDYINYFENGVKPKMRRKWDGEEKEDC